MNLCKRACLYSVRKKGKTLTLLAFLLVMATLMLTCLSIQSATETANANIKKALLGYFTINAKTLGKRHPGGYGKPNSCYGWLEWQVHPALLHLCYLF